MANFEIPHGKPAIGLHPINWSAAIWASVIGGLLFAVLEVLMVAFIQGQSPWAPLHMIGAIALGSGAMASPDTFDPGIIGTAVVVHMALAILYGVVLAFLITRLDIAMATAVGRDLRLRALPPELLRVHELVPVVCRCPRLDQHLHRTSCRAPAWALLYKMFDRRMTTAPPVSQVRGARRPQNSRLPREALEVERGVRRRAMPLRVPHDFAQAFEHGVQRRVLVAA